MNREGVLGTHQCDFPPNYNTLDNFNELMNRSIIHPIDLGNNTNMMLKFILQKSICENVITLLHD